MPDLTYPGVYIQEKPGAPAPIAGVATSTLGLLGFTKKGPINDPVLVTGFKEFERKFGGFISESILPTTLHAFFKNGGSLARIVRVVGAGATSAVAYISDTVADEDSGLDGDDATLIFSWTLASTPVEPGSLTLEFWVRPAAVSGEAGATAGANPRTGTAAAISDGIQPGTFVATDGTETFTDNSDGTLTGDLTGTGTIDYLTGDFSLTYNTAPVSPTTIDYQPLNFGSVTDDGAGALTAAGITGTVDYDTGDVSVTLTQAPAANYPSSGSTSATQDVLADYGAVIWQLDLDWPGAAGNDFRVVLFGSSGFEDDANATYTKWSINLEELNDEGEWEIVEQYAEMEFSDSTDPDFFPLVVNDENAGSQTITVVDVGNTGVPADLSGVQQSAEGIGSGNNTDTQFTGTLAGGSCHETTLTITVDALTVTDDGEGNLIGDVDATGVNTIDYDTGAFDVTFSSAPSTGVDNILATYFTQGDEAVTDQFAGGSDGAAVTSSETISAALEADDEGLYAFNKTDDLLLLTIPDFAGDEIVDGALVDYCVQRMDRFAILATPEGQDFNQAVNYKKRTLNKNNVSYAAIYHPWITILDPVTEKALNVPPVGHVAGVYARTDTQKNVGKAPAGAQDGALRFAIGLETEYTQAQVGQLNINRVNALVNWPQVGTFAVWGARTLEVGGEFGYIQARRLFMFLEKSIFNATHIYVFENNGSALWARIRLQLTGFLFRLFSQGYFAGDTPEQAFFVIVDATNNPQESIDAGILNVDVGVAPNKPAEFIVFTFQQKLPG